MIAHFGVLDSISHQNWFYNHLFWCSRLGPSEFYQDSKNIMESSSIAVHWKVYIPHIHPSVSSGSFLLLLLVQSISGSSVRFFQISKDSFVWIQDWYEDFSGTWESQTRVKQTSTDSKLYSKYPTKRCLGRILLPESWPLVMIWWRYRLVRGRCSSYWHRRSGTAKTYVAIINVNTAVIVKI